MESLLKAIYNESSGSALATDVSGRIFLDRAPEGSVFPYIVFSIVGAIPIKTFSEDMKDVSIQFSLFSSSASAVEISDMHADLMSLYDECELTIPPTGAETDVHVWMRWAYLYTMVDSVTTPKGTIEVKHWAVDFDVLTSKI